MQGVPMFNEGNFTGCAAEYASALKEIFLGGGLTGDAKVRCILINWTLTQYSLPTVFCIPHFLAGVTSTQIVGGVSHWGFELGRRVVMAALAYYTAGYDGVLGLNWATFPLPIRRTPLCPYGIGCLPYGR